MIDKVLVTTSGIGSRLGNLTDFTNKCLVRVGNKPAISHIIEKYPPDFEFVITLGHHGDLVRQFLTLTYPSHNFTFVEVDNYRDKGSSLGYSIIQAKSFLQQPFIFHACDTLMSDHDVIIEMLNFKNNFCVGAEREDASQYATLLISNNKLMQIKRKGELNFDLAYVGIAGIFDYDFFFETLEKLYLSEPSDTSLNEGRAINEMLKKVKFSTLKTSSWLDMGNVGELERARNFYKAEADVLEKTEESIYFFDEFVVKFFSNKEISKNRVSRAKNLGRLIPEILDHTDNFYKYKKEKGSLLAHSVTEDKFRKLLIWSNQNLWKHKPVDNFEKMCHTFYVDKTISRIEKYLKYSNDSSLVNEKQLPPIHQLLGKIDLDWLCNGHPVMFHGDFILDNILETECGFCLLDWRQDFAGDLSCGDIYYDLAKLNHNLTVNHEIVNKGLFSEDPNNCYILCSSKHIECQEILRQFVIEAGYDYSKVELLTAIIWLNMSPLHEYPFNKFLFNFGKYKLAKVIENEY